MKFMLIAVLVLGGLMVSGLAYMLGTADAVPVRAGAEVAPQPPSVDLQALQEAVSRLQKENEELRMELEMLGAASRCEPVAGFVPLAEFEAFRDEVLAALPKNGAVEEVVESSTPDAFEEKVASALIEIRQKEQFDAVRDYHEKRNARLEEDVENLANWLEMNADQVSEMRRALLVQYDREAEQARLWEAGENPEVLGELKRTDGEAFDRDLRTFLSDGQVETFWDGILGRGEKDD